MFNDLNIRRESLPSSLPIFPLSGTMLLPGIEMPLNIFESKYINMIDDVLAEKKLIGIIQPQNSIFSKVTKNKSLYKVGCVGKIRAFNETDDGRYLIVLSGITRFNILEEITTMRGYRRFKVDYSKFGSDFDIKGDREIFRLSIDRKSLFSKINLYLKRNSIESSLNNLEGLESVELGFLIDFLCSYLPFSTEEKQLFLECKTLDQRAKELFNVLGIAEAQSKYKINTNTLH